VTSTAKYRKRLFDFRRFGYTIAILAFTREGIMTDANVLEKKTKSRKEEATDQPSAAARAVPSLAPKRLLIASGKGGSAKTTCTQILAFLAKAEGKRVAMVDLDKQRTLSKWCARRSEDMPHVDCYESSMAEVTAEINGLTDYDLVIIDTPPGLDDYPVETKKLIARVDYVLAPTGVRAVETESAIEMLRIVTSLGKPGAYLLTRTNRRTSAFTNARRLLSGAPGTVCPVDIPQYEDIGAAQDGGFVVTEVRGGKGTDDMAAVWAFVKKELAL
jgi:chromosome partitioning protein